SCSIAYLIGRPRTTTTRSTIRKFRVLIVRYTRLSPCKHPLVSGIIVEVPNALGTCHHIKIVRFVSVWDDDRMVTPGHQDNIAVLDSHGLVNIARIGVDTLENKTLRRIDPMVVGLL